MPIWQYPNNAIWSKFRVPIWRLISNLAESLPELAQDSWCSNPLAFLQKSQNASDSWPELTKIWWNLRISWQVSWVSLGTTLVFCWYSFLDLLDKSFSKYELFSQRTGKRNNKYWAKYLAWYKSIMEKLQNVF